MSETFQVGIEHNPFKRAIANGELQIGLWSSLVSNICADILSDAGYDWIVVDMEHASNEIATVLAQLQALKGGSATPMVRPPWNDPVVVKRILDLGAQTLLFPMIETAEQAELAVAATRYPPKGIRGVSLSQRGNRYGRVGNYAEVVEDELCIIVQIETRKGMANLEEIAAVAGIDGLFFGPADLSAGIGLIGQLSHEKVHEILLEGLERCRAAGKPAGILTGIEADAKKFIDAGYTFVAIGADQGILAKESVALRRRFKPD
jgi:4-hydroxy-2-oxoheptanedioate aldolase